MKSVFMGKSAAQWLIKSIKHTVVGVSSKHFFIIRDGDIAYTLQHGSNSFSQFLLLTELKVGGFRRFVIIPEGNAKNGRRVFGLGLRKMLEPNQYAMGGSGHSKFIAQPLKNSELQISRTFADTLKGYHVLARDRKNPEQLATKEKGKAQLGEKRMVVPNPELAKLLLSEKPVANPCLTAVGGGTCKAVVE